MVTLKISYHSKFQTHKKQIFTQALSMQLFMIVKIVLDIWQMDDFAGVQKSEESDFFLGSAVYYT
jgi:hypothetical protein